MLSLFIIALQVVGRKTSALLGRHIYGTLNVKPLFICKLLYDLLTGNIFLRLRSLDARHSSRGCLGKGYQNPKHCPSRYTRTPDLIWMDDDHLSSTIYTLCTSMRTPSPIVLHS